MAKLAAAAKLPLAATTEGAKAADQVTLTGTVAIAAELGGRIRAGDTLFVVAREAQSRNIVAVSALKATPASTWPMAFVLADERLQAGMATYISVRVDRDGDASTRAPGDLVGEGKEAVVAPNSAVTITVDRVL